jgi:hypothetical protein
MLDGVQWHCPEDVHFKAYLSLPEWVSTAAGTLSIRRHPIFINQPVIMLSDVPHLIKKSRNNLEKSANPKLLVI